MISYDTVGAPPPSFQGMPSSSHRSVDSLAEYRPLMSGKPEVHSSYYYHTMPMAIPEPYHYGPATNSMSPARVGLSDPRDAYVPAGVHDVSMRNVPRPPSRYVHEPMEYGPVHSIHELPPPLMAHNDGSILQQNPSAPMDMGSSLHDDAVFGPTHRIHAIPPHHPQYPQDVPPRSAIKRVTSQHATTPLPPPSFTDAPASKRDRKRKDVLERLDRAHWETFENRDPLYQDAYMGLSSTYYTLMMRPSFVREYAMKLADQTVRRDASLLEASLYHAFLVDRSRHTYDLERSRVEDEARVSKRSVRDKLLGVIEERKRLLKDERDIGDFTGDYILEHSHRQHSTRQLRNKDSSSNGAPARLGQLLDYEQTESSAYLGIATAVAQLLGWSETEATMAIAAASTGGDGNLLCRAPDGINTRLPLLETFASQASLLAGINVTPSTGKGKKKDAVGKLSSRSAIDRSDDDDALTTTTPLLSSGGGRLRWDTAKCLSQLTSAKDFEVEADLIHIHQIGQKRRRR